MVDVYCPMVILVAIQGSKRPAHGPSRMASQLLRQQESFTQTSSVASSGLKLSHTMHTQRQAALGLHEKRVYCAWKERSMLFKKETSCCSDSMCNFLFCSAYVRPAVMLHVLKSFSAIR